ncbi:MAG: TolC family protein [Candidatus Aminicenantes bacterium]|nr:TolC family protein [Candidatus Aminicenantes bacterium]
MTHTTARFQLCVRIRIAAAGLLFFFPAAFGRSEPADKSLSLTLRQCVKMALRENLSLSIERLNPAMDTLALMEIREKFLPQFVLTYQNSDTNTPGAWGVEGSNVAAKSDSLSFGLTQSFAWGTSLSLNVSSSMTNTTRSFTTINPSYYSSVQLNLIQPLLRGFGAKAANVEAIKAERTIEMADASLHLLALQTVCNVEEAYWNLVQARENLKVQESSLVSSREVLARNREAARIGTESGSEVLNAEAEVARYEDAVLSAARSIQSQEDQLKKLLHLPAGGEETIILLDPPTIEIREVSAEEVLRAALANRPEMDISRRKVENSQSDVDYYRNQALPKLDLNFSFWNPGISGVKYIYQDDNPLTGIVIDRIVGGRRDSFTDILKGKYENWSVDLDLEVPLANLLTRPGLGRARASGLRKAGLLVRTRRPRRQVLFWRCHLRQAP